jgi:hypothetical protein
VEANIKMDAVPLLIASLPLALYLLAVGVINLRRRATIVTGPVDVAGMALAVGGLVMVGPMNLFLPAGAAIRFGPFAWLLVAGFYCLCTLLYVLMARPRFVIFNITREQFRPLLEQAVRRLDQDAQLAGDAVQLPQLSVQFHLDVVPVLRNVSIVATSDMQSYSGWKRLQRELSAALKSVEVARNPRGFTFLACGLALIGWPVLQLLQTSGADVAQQLQDILRM